VQCGGNDGRESKRREARSKKLRNAISGPPNQKTNSWHNNIAIRGEKGLLLCKNEGLVLGGKENAKAYARARAMPFVVKKGGGCELPSRGGLLATTGKEKHHRGGKKTRRFESTHQGQQDVDANLEKKKKKVRGRAERED